MAITQTRPADIDVQSLDPYHFFAVLGKQVIHPGGRRSTDELSAWPISNHITACSTPAAASPPLRSAS